MGDDSASALDRIDRAIARIEAALAERARVEAILARRNHALRDHVTQAIAALDAVIDQGTGD